MRNNKEKTDIVEAKKCTGECGEIRTLGCFEKGRDKCKVCRAQYQKKYQKENKEKISEQGKEYRKENKEKISKYKKEYQKENKEEIVEYQKEYRKENKEEKAKKAKEYYQENKEKIVEKKKEHRKENKEKIIKFNKEYYEENKEEIIKQHNKYCKERRKLDPVYRLRKNISRSINSMLKYQDSSKEGHSILEFLPTNYFDDLNPHIERQFELWMTRDNYGSYNSKTWNDNDPTTWRWQLDHITPQSDLPYTSMEDDNFKKCWALSNLRPLSAKQNFLDGVNRTRHAKK